MKWHDKLFFCKPLLPITAVAVFLVSGCAIRDPEPIVFKSDIRDFLAIQPKIQAIHFKPWERIFFDTSPRSDWYSMKDPLTEVKSQFLTELRSALSLNNMVVVPQHRLNYDLSQLKRTYKQGLVFVFHTARWRLKTDKHDTWSVRVEYDAIGRLIRVETEEVLWRKDCNAVVEGPAATANAVYSMKPSFFDFDATRLRTLRDEVAKKCAYELLTHLLSGAV